MIPGVVASSRGGVRIVGFNGSGWGRRREAEKVRLLQGGEGVYFYRLFRMA